MVVLKAIEDFVLEKSLLFSIFRIRRLVRFKIVVVYLSATSKRWANKLTTHLKI
jgi:hypothetical protein